MLMSCDGSSRSAAVSVGGWSGPPAAERSAGPRIAGDLVVGTREALGGDGGDDRVDAADQVGTAGGGVLVGGLEQRP